MFYLYTLYSLLFILLYIHILIYYRVWISAYNRVHTIHYVCGAYVYFIILSISIVYFPLEIQVN